jgi:membrane protein implicated in regulation of membrane protease activity
MKEMITRNELTPFHAKLCFCVTLIGVLVGYGRPVRESDLPGTYVADRGFAVETLTVKHDGKFVQTVKVNKDGRVVVTNGTWRVRSEDKDIYFSEEFMVVIDGFGNLIPEFDHPKRKAISILPVRRIIGRVEIGGDDLPWGREGVENPYTKVANEIPKQ